MTSPGSARRPPPARVRVTSPRRGATEPAAARPRAEEIDEQTALGEVYVDALMRAQRRLVALVLACLVVAVVLMVGAVSLLSDDVGSPVPPAWVLLGVVVYPLLLVGAVAYSRAADRVEDEFVDLLGRR